jgi:hypothetical protein
VADKVVATVDSVPIFDVAVKDRVVEPLLNCNRLKPFSLMASHADTRVRNIRVRVVPPESK